VAGLRKLFDQVQDALILADLEGRIVLWNAAAARMFGWSAEEALQRSLDVLVPERLLETHLAEMARRARNPHAPMLDGGTVVQAPALRKDGSEIRIEVTLSHVDHGGTYLLAIVRDLARSLELERALETQRREAVVLDRIARLAIALGSATDLPTVYRSLRAFLLADAPRNGIFVSLYDPETDLRTCTYAVTEGEEVDVSTLPPLPMTNSPNSRAVRTGEVIITDDFDAAMRGSPRVNLGLERDPRLPSSSIVVPMLVHGAAIGAIEIQSTTPAAFGPHNVPTLRMAANLAAIAVQNVRLLEKEKERSLGLESVVKERTQELALKNKELEAFSFTVAHDLRAPLRAILYLSDSLVEDYGRVLDADALERLRAMSDSAHRMSQLVQDLLNLARADKEVAKREDVDLTRLAREVLDEARARDPARDATLTVHPDMRARGDPRLLRIVLDNLVSNAWKYSRKKPRTVIEVGMMERDAERVFFVRDEGVGYDPAKADRLFGAFQRLHAVNEYEGTGIGLATVARIIRHHGGRAWAEGRPGEGATFFFTLGK
jgi:PAS domain S-box-containing protein